MRSATIIEPIGSKIVAPWSTDFVQGVDQLKNFSANLTGCGNVGETSAWFLPMAPNHS